MRRLRKAPDGGKVGIRVRTEPKSHPNQRSDAQTKTLLSFFLSNTIAKSFPLHHTRDFTVYAFFNKKKSFFMTTLHHTFTDRSFVFAFLDTKKCIWRVCSINKK